MIHAIALVVACLFADPPAKRWDVEAGSSTDTLTGNRGTWNEQYLTVAMRDGPQHAAYAAVTTDQRFGLNDITYEAGAYVPIAPKLIFDAIASFSPTHQVLPDSALQGGLDLRAGSGYGYQATYAQRNYSSAIADIATAGADRYRGNQHFSVTLTAVHLSNVPGTAMSAGVAYTGISSLRHPVICGVGRERRRKHGHGHERRHLPNDLVFSKRPALVYAAHRFGLRPWMVSLDRRLRPFRVARCSSRTALAYSSS